MSPKKVVKKGAHPASGADSAAALNSRYTEGNINKGRDHKANISAGYANKAASPTNANGSTALAAAISTCDCSEPKTYLTAMLSSGPKQKSNPDAAVSPDQAQHPPSTFLSGNIAAGSSAAQTSAPSGGATGMGMGVALRTIRSEAPVADVVPVRVNLNLPPPDFDNGASSFTGANNLRAGEEIRRILGIRVGTGALPAPPTLALNTQYHYQHSITPPPPSMQRHAAGSMIPALHVDSCPPVHFHQPHQLQNPPPIGGSKEQGNHYRDPLQWRVAPTVLPPPPLPPAYTYDAATAAAWEREQGTMAAGDGANVDDLLDLIEEFWANMDEASPPYGSPTGKTPSQRSRSADGHGRGHAAGRYTELVSDASANWGDSMHIQAQANVHWSGTALVSGSRGVEGVSISAGAPSSGSPIPEQFSFTLDGLLEGLTRGSDSSTPRGSTSTSPATRPTTPKHNQSPQHDRSTESSPPQSIPRGAPKDYQEEQPMPQRAHHTLPDVVATVDGIKSLILAPHIPEKPLSLLAHRIGPTLLLEGTTTAGLDVPVTVAEARKKALRHKLLYYSVLMSPPSRAGEKEGIVPEATNVPRERRADEEHDRNADVTRKPTVDGNDAAASSTRQREPAPNEEAAYQTGRSIFRKTMQWNLSDMNILIGATQPTFKDRSSGQEVNLQVHEIDDLRVPQKMPTLPSPSAAAPYTADASGVILPTTMALFPLSPANPSLSPNAPADGSIHVGGSATTTAPLVGTAPDAPKLDRSSALEYWLDNILSNVASVALCYHRDGDVQGYQVVPTHHLPQMADPSFSPVAVQASSTQVLKWLQQGTSTGGTSFVVVKDAGSCELKLYDITGLSSGGIKEMLRHPDSRSKRRVIANPVDAEGEDSRYETNSKSYKDGGTLVASTNTANNNTQKTSEEAATPLDSFTGALVPVSSFDKNTSEAIATGDRARGTAALTSFIRGCRAALGGGTSAVDAAIASSGAIPSSAAFKHLKYPYAMMCFRMAQCLPPLTKDAYKMWQHVATLLSVRDEEALFPLATAHVAMMEYHAAGCSQLPDSDRQAITHASRAVQALHILDRCVKQAMLPQSVLEGISAFGGGFGNEKKKTGGGKRSPTTPVVTEEDLAQLLEDALEGDPDITQTVEQMRGLCVRVVNCMLKMGERELVRGKSLANGETDVDGFTDDIDDPKMGIGSVAYPAIVLGRVVENILVAQAALMLRAFEVPSGLIMANPDLVVSSDVSSHQLSTTNTGRQALPSTPSMASVSHPRAASVATANTVDSSVAPSPSSLTFIASPSRANQHQLTKREHTVLQCFERIATLSGDVVSTHLQHVLSHSTADAEAQKGLVGEIQQSSHHHKGAASPPTVNPSETCLHRYISKLNRDLKVTFSVLEGIASSAASLGTNAPPASSITGASVPDHVNFVGRMAPLDANPITCAEIAISLYQQAVGHRHSLQVWNHQQPSKPPQQATTANSNAEPIPPFYSSNALSRKIAAIHAVVAEFYARGLAAHLVPKDGAAMSPSSLMNESTATMMMFSGSDSSPLTTAASPNVSADNAVMGPLRDSREAYANFDRAATAFINCKDFANAALNLQNASKMCLRAAQALAKLKAVRQLSFTCGHADAARREAAEIEDNAAIEEEHRRAIAALEKAEQLPKGGAAGMTAAIADNVRQFAFSVYIYSFQWEMEQLARSAVSNASFSSVSTVSSASSAPLPIVSASTLKRLHDRYLAPALKIPKKLAHLMPSETQRAMEAKVLSSMINLYWLAYPSQVSFTTSPSLNMSPPDRIICLRFAKTRLRQFWTGYLRGSLSPTNANVALSLWLEATRVVTKMIACDLFLFTHGNGSPDPEASSSVASTTEASPEAAFNEKVQCVERAFTSIVDWRLWLRMAEGGLVVIPQSEAATVGSSHASHRGGGGGGGASGGANQKKKGGKQSSTSSVPIEKDIRAELLLLAEAALPIAKHLSTTLLCLLKLIKEQGAAPTIVTTAASVSENVKRSLQVSTRDTVAVAAANGGDNDKSRLEWLSQFGKCVDEAEKIFNGRRTR